MVRVMGQPRLEGLAGWFREMAEAEHKPDCPSLTAKEPFWSAWAIEMEDGAPARMRWRGPRPKWEPPTCDGCNSQGDRDLFSRLASEVESYVEAKQEALFP